MRGWHLVGTWLQWMDTWRTLQGDALGDSVDDQDFIFVTWLHDKLVMENIAEIHGMGLILDRIRMREHYGHGTVRKLYGNSTYLSSYLTYKFISSWMSIFTTTTGGQQQLHCKWIKRLLEVLVVEEKHYTVEEVKNSWNKVCHFILLFK